MAVNVSRINIQAPASKVWEALTKPELVKLWQYGSTLITDWQAGGDIRFRNEWEGNVYEQWGKVAEVVPGSLIRYSLFAPRPGVEDKPENYFMMSYRLSENDGSTLLTIEQSDNRPESGIQEPQEAQEAQEDEGEGATNPILAALKNLAETL